MTSSTQRVDLLVTGARQISTMDDDGRVINDGWMAVDDGRVVGFGGATDPRPKAQEIVDASGCLVTPGLINAHQHLYQSLTRSMTPDFGGSLTSWFWTYFTMWQHMNEEAIRTSTRIGLMELALSGCTTSVDHLYIHREPGWIDAQVQEARDVGLRFTAVRGSMTLDEANGGVCPTGMAESDQFVLDESARLVHEWHDANPDSMTHIALGPSTLMSSSDAIFRDSADLALQLGVRLHTHAADDPDEERYVFERYGKRPIQVLDEFGWLRPGTWLAHVVYPNESERALLAERSVAVVHCPSAMVIDGGIPGGPAPVREMLDAGVTVAIGCDGATAADHQSIIWETKFAMLLARLRGGTTAAMTAREALSLATRGGATAIGRSGEIGQLAIGTNADFVLWRMDGVAHAGALRDPVVGLLHGGPINAWATYVGGRPIVQRGELVGVDVGAEVSRHTAAATRLQRFLND
ncbi:MAG: amidohydrolase family protein [Actinobacteria bacterium]|nr:amidohydrolase family protein [Actinomycetota bacterium]